MLTKKVKMYVGYIDRLRTIHDCKEIADTFNRSYPKYEMKKPPDKQGALEGVFYLTLSDISAVI